MGIVTTFRWSTIGRTSVGVLIAVTTIAASIVVVDEKFAWSEEQTTPVVGSFSVGAGLAGGIEERTGAFATQIPLVGLPGLISRSDDESSRGVGEGGFSLGISYRHEAAQTGENRFAVGTGWMWNMTYVDTNGGVRVFPASGGMFEADASWSSGLRRYTLENLKFFQQPGVLPPRNGVVGEVSYAYSLVYANGMTDFFSATGDLVARLGLFGGRADLLWGSDHRLMKVVDAAGSCVDVVWTETGVKVVSPARSDGVVATMELTLNGNRLVSVTNPVGDDVSLSYETDGLLEHISAGAGAGAGALTSLTYQKLPDGSTAVDRLRVINAETGEELLQRAWKIVGGRTFSGYPTYTSESSLWASGDGEYRYHTVLFDGFTQVMSEYNSLGLLVCRDLVVSTSGGDTTMRSQRLTFPGSEEGGVPPAQALPKQYAQPIETVGEFHDEWGHTRTVTETMKYNDTGQITQQRSADGAVTETTYDTHVPEGMLLPLGLILQQTTVGPDGTVSKTVNTLAPDRKSVQATEVFVGAVGAVGADGELSSTSRTEVRMGSDGFVTEQRLIATGSVAEGPHEVVTKFARAVNREKKIVTLSTTAAAGTDAESTTSTHIDFSTGLPVSSTDPTGRVATTSYDPVGRVREETDYKGLRTTTDYGSITDNGARVTRVTDPRGVTRSEYVDVLGRVVKITDNITHINAQAGYPVDEPSFPSGDAGDVFGPRPGFERVIETRSYENNASHITATDARGLKTVTVSDLFGRPVRVTAPNGVTQITKYDDVNNTVTIGKVQESHSQLLEASRVITTQNDNLNREISVTGSRKDAVEVPHKTTHYDGLGRIIERQSGDLSQRVSLNPDGTPRTTTITSLKEPSHAGAATPEAVTPEAIIPGAATPDPDPAIRVDREHDIFGVSTKKTLGQKEHKQEGVARVLDAAGRTVSKIDQAGNTATYEYTRDGLVAVVRNGTNGVVTHNSYDPRTRALSSTDTTENNETVSRTAFEYEPVSGLVTAVFDPDDRENTSIRYTYDVFGNTTSTTYPDGKQLTHVFNEFSQKIRSTDIEGNITHFEYGQFGLLSGVTQTSSEGNIRAGVEYRYDNFGRITEVARKNGLITRYTFTSADEIASEKTTTHNDTVIHEGVYEYDSHGNLTKQRDTRGEVSTPVDLVTETETHGSVTETRVHTYTPYNQLASTAIYAGSAVDGEPSTRSVYEIDVSGSVTREITTTGTKTKVREFEHNPLGHIIAVTTNGVREEQTYDAAGNQIESIEGVTYAYNAHNQLIHETHPDGSAVEHTYWVTGQRRTTTHTRPEDGIDSLALQNSHETVGMYWDNTTLINESYNTAGEQAIASYLMGVSRHSRTINGKTNYYVTDRHGSTTALVGDNPQITGNTQITIGYTYTDYGKATTYIPSGSSLPTESSPLTESSENMTGERNPFQYAGEYTTVSGMQYLGARMYNPNMMAFTSQDNAEQFNLYAYANSNPLTHVDPTGHVTAPDSRALGIFLGLGALGMILSAGMLVPVVMRASMNAAWGVVGVGTASLLLDWASMATSSFQLYDYHHNKGQFFTDGKSEVLTALGVSFGIASAALFTGWAAVKSAQIIGAHLDVQAAKKNLRKLETRLTQAEVESSEARKIVESEATRKNLALATAESRKKKLLEKVQLKIDSGNFTDTQIKKATAAVEEKIEERLKGTYAWIENETAEATHRSFKYDALQKCKSVNFADLSSELIGTENSLATELAGFGYVPLGVAVVSVLRGSGFGTTYGLTNQW